MQLDIKTVRQTGRQTDRQRDKERVKGMRDSLSRLRNTASMLTNLLSAVSCLALTHRYTHTNTRFLHDDCSRAD